MKTTLVRDLAPQSIFEIGGIRYRKMYSNESRAYVRDLDNNEYCNISPNSEIEVADDDAEDLI